MIDYYVMGRNGSACKQVETEQRDIEITQMRNKCPPFYYLFLASEPMEHHKTLTDCLACVVDINNEALFYEYGSSNYASALVKAQECNELWVQFCKALRVYVPTSNRKVEWLAVYNINCPSQHFGDVEDE